MKSNENKVFMIRVTGVLIENEKMLIIKQRIHDRTWFLPGGRLETDERLEDGVIREFYEETGLIVKVQKLISVTDTSFRDPCMIHLLFLVKREGGEIRISENADHNPIEDVRFVELDELRQYGFHDGFIAAAKNGFFNVASYVKDDQFFDFES